MTNLPDTYLATSNPLDICSPNAFAYFGAGKSVDAGRQINGTIFDLHPSLVLWNFDFNLGYGLFLGLCGPAVALQMHLAGSYDSQSITVDVSQDEIQGGLVFGITLQLSLNFAIHKATLHWVKEGWKSHLERTWSTAFSAQVGIQLDMISLILGVVVKMLEEGDNKNTLLQKVNNINSNLVGSYGIFDDVINGFAAEGKFNVNPAFSLPINLVPFIPGLAQVNEGLEKLMGGLFIGPTIGFALPSSTVFKELIVGGTTYSNLQVAGSRVTGTAVGSAPADDNLKVNFEESPGFDIALGLGANLSVLKLFSVGFSFTFDLISLLGIEPTFGTFNYSLENQVGSQSIEMAQVFFDEPAQPRVS